MKPYWETDGNRIYLGDALSVLKSLPDESVHCCVTSPPYWSLRNYDVEGQIGLEETPEEFIEKMIEIFREVRRVLRSDGTLWLNLGDSYGQNWRGGGKDSASSKQISNFGTTDFMGKSAPMTNLKPKDLCGIPWRVALALQADGWWLRSDIIWHKPNPMPESVTDRPTKSHEYLFLLTKQSKYFYDAEAVKVAAAESTHNRGPVDFGGEKGRNYKPDKSDPNYRGGNEQWGRTYHYNGGTVNRRTVWTIPTQPFNTTFETYHPCHVELDDISGDTMRIPSLNCPVHGCLDRPSGEYGGDSLNRILDTCSCRAPKLIFGRFENYTQYDQQSHKNSLDYLGQKCFLSAIDHSKKNHKTGHALETNPACISFFQNFVRTAYKQGLHEIIEHISRIRESNTLVDSVLNEKAICPLVQISSRISYNDIPLPIPPSCLCLYYNIETKKSSHFAVFPEKLIEPCILAGTSIKCCAECGSPWERVVDVIKGVTNTGLKAVGRIKQKLTSNKTTLSSGTPGSIKTTGWQPTCKCNSDTIPCTVLDPFFGSGTTGIVAHKHGRKFVGIELSQKYLDEIAIPRIDKATKQLRLFN